MKPSRRSTGEPANEPDASHARHKGAGTILKITSTSINGELTPLDLRDEGRVFSSQPPRGTSVSKVPKTDLLQGTLDLLILRILALGPNHGWGIANRIRQMSKDGLNASQGSLYPALHRLEVNGDVRSEMTASENNRRARVYTITAAGRRRLDAETRSWEQFALSMKRVLQGE